MIPWRLIFLVLGIVLLLFFIGMNYDNSAKVQLWFGETGTINTNVVYVIAAGFLLGVFVSFPFIFKRKVIYLDLSKERLKDRKREKNKNLKNTSLMDSTSKGEKVYQMEEIDPHFKSLK